LIERNILSTVYIPPRVRFAYPDEFGAPTFDAIQVFGMMAAVLVSMVEVSLLKVSLLSFRRLCEELHIAQIDWHIV
jgi:hypothetical protein